MEYKGISKESNFKDIETALKLHCYRRARHLCKIYAEVHETDRQRQKMLYDELKVRYGLEKLV